MSLSFAVNERGVIMNGALPPGNLRIARKHQFFPRSSPVLFSPLPLLKGDSTVKDHRGPESEEYVTMTVSMLKQFGIQIDVEGNEYRIQGTRPTSRQTSPSKAISPSCPCLPLAGSSGVTCPARTSTGIPPRRTGASWNTGNRWVESGKKSKTVYAFHRSSPSMGLGGM
jgi:hypothetical protein